MIVQSISSFDLAAIVAVWRLSYILINEDGPFDVVERMGAFLFRLGAEKLATCFNCMSLWIGLAFALILHTGISVFVFGLFYAGLAMLLNLIYEKLEN